MKKKLLFMGFTFVVGMAIMPNVFAQTHTEWDTLKTCLTTNGSTCTLGDSITADDIITIGDNVTLDLGEHTLTVASNKTLWINGGHEVTIKGDGGKIISEGPYSTLSVKGNASSDSTKLTIEEGVEITGVVPVAIYSASDNTAENNASVIQIDGDLRVTSGDSVALSINGKIQGGPQVNITGNLTGVSAGIYQAGSSDITIDGGSVTGQSGVVTKAGTLHLKNATVTATGEPSEGTPLDGAFDPTGAGIQIEAKSNYQGNINIDIQEGTTITSEQGDAIQAYGDEEDKIEALNITGENITLNAPNGKVLDTTGDINFPEVTANDEIVNLSEMTVFTTNSVEATPEESTENPDTADTNVYGLLTLILVSGLGLGYVIRKRMN